MSFSWGVSGVDASCLDPACAPMFVLEAPAWGTAIDDTGRGHSAAEEGQEE